jgi:hypothetical protein
VAVAPTAGSRGRMARSCPGVAALLLRVRGVRGARRRGGRTRLMAGPVGSWAWVGAGGRVEVAGGGRGWVRGGGGW